VVALVGSWTQQARLSDLRERSEARLDLHATVLQQQLARVDALPAAIRLNPDVLDLVRDPGTFHADRVNHFLQALNAEADASVLYVLDPEGSVLAASNWDHELSFVGVDLSYRPYVQDAVRQGSGRFFDIGTTSGEPGYFYAVEISGSDGVIGVAAVKISLDELQSPWRQNPNHAALVVDGDGVVILSSEPSWRYRTLAPLPEDTLARFRSTRQFENVRLDPLPIRTERVLEPEARLVSAPDTDTGGGRKFLLQERQISPLNWRMMVLSDLEDLQAVSRAVQITTGFALGLALLIVLLVRQRHRMVSLEILAKQGLEQANADLERKVEERTRDLLAAQDELVHAGRLAALGQMAAVVAHELNQPLSALRTLSDNAATLIQRERLKEAEGNLGMIAQIVERMAKISAQLKLFASKPATTTNTTPLAPCIEHTTLLLAPRLDEQEVIVSSDLRPPDLLVRVDAGQMEQVLVNLMVNALDAMRDMKGGRIEIRAGVEGGTVLLTVRDNGPGISDPLLAQLTEPFFTTKSVGAGLGLGLTIIDSIVRDAGGALRIRNHPDGGAEFVIELPNAAAARGTDG
jgi:C4-dicarboxylate-specific signal transduction histidine kinase